MATEQNQIDLNGLDLTDEEKALMVKLVTSIQLRILNEMNGIVKSTLLAR
jgi:hypothetical protein